MEQIRIGDSWLSPTWAIVMDGQTVDLDDGWTVLAQARDRDNHKIIDFAVLPGTAQVKVGDATITTSTVRLYLTAATTSALAPKPLLRFDVEMSNPTAGPLDDPFRVTLVSSQVQVVADVTRAS